MLIFSVYFDDFDFPAGHSIGGGVMSMVVGEFPKATIINDRSFWDLGAEVGTIDDDSRVTVFCIFYIFFDIGANDPIML